jgi:thiamine biosynthesis lipoprotein
MSNEPSQSPSSPPSAPHVLDGEATYGSLKRFVLPGLFVVALFAALLWRRPPASNVRKVQTWMFRGPIFGTSYTVKVILRKAPGLTKHGLHREIKRALHRVNDDMSTYKKDSTLSLFNKAKHTNPMKVSAAMLEVLQEAKRLSTLTGGAFDITIGPIVNLWGFGPTRKLKNPTPAQIQLAKQRVGIDKLVLDTKASTMRKTIPGLYVDLSAIAKGYGVDVVGRRLEAAGFRDYLVEIGGEVRARGTNQRGVSWMIGVEKPQTSQTQTIQLVVPLRDASMATSGNYRNYQMVDGKRVSHLIDARSGTPVANHFSSVTVVHKDCMTADALATALFVLGPKEGLRLAKKHKLSVLFLIPKGKGFIKQATPAFAALLKQMKTNAKQ